MSCRRMFVGRVVYIILRMYYGNLEKLRSQIFHCIRLNQDSAGSISGICADAVLTSPFVYRFRKRITTDTVTTTARSVSADDDLQLLIIQADCHGPPTPAPTHYQRFPSHYHPSRVRILFSARYRTRRSVRQRRKHERDVSQVIIIAHNNCYVRIPN